MHNEPDQTSPRAQFAADLQRLRKDRGLSQVALSGYMSVHQSLISHVERGVRPPTQDFAEAADRTLGLDGHFTHLYARIIQSPALGWFSRWVEEVEPRATMLWTWDPLLVPGLLQTEAYARAIFASISDPDRVDRQVQARVARVAIFNKPTAPSLLAVIDEGVLHRPIGGKRVLIEQLRHLLNLAQHPRITVQLVPIASACAPGMMSAFTLARLDSGAELVSADSVLSGQVTGDLAALARLKRRYDTIRADAQPRAVSQQTIEDAITRWMS